MVGFTTNHTVFSKPFSPPNAGLSVVYFATTDSFSVFHWEILAVERSTAARPVRVAGALRVNEVTFSPLRASTPLRLTFTMEKILLKNKSLIATVPFSAVKSQGFATKTSHASSMVRLLGVCISERLIPTVPFEYPLAKAPAGLKERNVPSVRSVGTVPSKDAVVPVLAVFNKVAVGAVVELVISPMKIAS